MEACLAKADDETRTRLTVGYTALSMLLSFFRIVPSVNVPAPE
jgi:hypothetical protein